jgi:hypothetical protein
VGAAPNLQAQAPLPVSETVATPAATLSVAVLAPVEVGVKRICVVQADPALSEVNPAQAGLPVAVGV